MSGSALRPTEPIPAATTREADTVPQDAGLVGFLNVLLRHRVLVIVLPAIVAAVLLVFGLLRERQYSSDASFAPQRANRMPSALSGFATQFGFQLPQDNLDQSPAFYADLLRSREILGPVVERRYAASLAGGGRDRTLIEILEIDEDGDLARRYAAIDALSKRMRVATDGETGVVSFSVRLPLAALAHTVAEQIIERINDFNLNRRQSVAAAERRFVEERLQFASRQLSDAEQRLRQFDERNLRIDNSPGLRLERDRLAREVDSKQQLVTSLSQAYEQARIDEIRNTPAITIIERPRLPIKPDPRGALTLSFAGLVIAGFVGVASAFALEFWRGVLRGETRTHGEFRRLQDEVAALWRRRG